MEQITELTNVFLLAGGLFFVIAVLRLFYRHCRNKGYFRSNVTGEKDMRAISTIDQGIRGSIGEAMDCGKNCQEIVKILVLTRYKSHKHPLEKAFRDRLVIRARAATLASLRSGFAMSHGFIRKYPLARIVLARECFREALILCQVCSAYTLENINSAQCPVHQYFIKNSAQSGA